MLALKEKVSASLTRYNMLSPGDGVGVGVSGGADSVTLLHVLHGLALYRIVVFHVNHELRGKESEDDEQFVRALAEKFGLPVEVRRRAVGSGNLEQEARNARREFFAEARLRLNLRARGAWAQPERSGRNGAIPFSARVGYCRSGRDVTGDYGWTHSPYAGLDPGRGSRLGRGTRDYLARRCDQSEYRICSQPGCVWRYLTLNWSAFFPPTPWWRRMRKAGGMSASPTYTTHPCQREQAGCGVSGEPVRKFACGRTAPIAAIGHPQGKRRSKVGRPITCGGYSQVIGQ